MLADWYFCGCVGHDDKVTPAVLSVLGALREQAPDARRLGIALDELRRADVWTRVYAIPGVMRALSSQVLFIEDTQVAQDLLFALGESITAAGDWPQLLDHLASGQPGEQLAALLEDCAAGLLDAQPLEIARTPYLDLPAQCGAVLLLSALGQALEGVRAAEFVDALKQADGALQWLVDVAVRENRFGRLPMRLACHALFAAGLGPDFSRLKAQLGPLEREPDLSELMARAWLEPLKSDVLALQSVLADASVPPDVQAHAFALALRFDSKLAFQALANGRRSPTDQGWWKPFSNNADHRYVVRRDDAVPQLGGVLLAIAAWLHDDSTRQLPLDTWMFVAHASDVLYSIAPRVPKDKPARRLIEVARSIVARIATQRLPLGQFLDHMDRELNDGATDRLKLRVSVCLVQWFYDGFGRAIGDHPACEWVSGVQRLLDFVAAAANRFPSNDLLFGDDERLTNECIERFFSLRQTRLSQPSADDPLWPHAKRRRELFLMGHLTEADWYPQVADPADADTLLFLRTERCAAWRPGSAHEPFTAWTQAMAGIANVFSVDRFFRLHLIELIDHEYFAVDHKQRMADVVLSIGSTYEMNSLLSRVFSGRHPELADRVQAALVARVELQRERAENRDAVLEVWRSEELRGKHQLLKDWLAWFLAPEQPQGRERARQLLQRRAQIRAFAGAAPRRIVFSIEHRSGEERLVPLSDDDVQWPFVLGAAIDREHQRATLLLTEFAAPGPVGSVTKPATRVRPGDLARIRVDGPMAGEGPPSRVRLEELQVDLPTRQGVSSYGWFDPRNWTFHHDTTALLLEPRWARLLPSGEWRPLAEDRLALLAAMPAEGRATLAWLNIPERASSGNPAWLVESSGGIRFALAEADFEPKSWLRLHSRVQPADALGAGFDEFDSTPAGILVTLGVAASGKLELKATSDDRLRWLRLYSYGDLVRVETRPPRDLVVALPEELRQAGRPDTVKALLGRGQWAADEAWFDAHVEAWDAARALLTVQRIVTNHVEAPPGDWPGICFEWLKLSPGDSVALNEEWGNIERANCFAKTDRGFVVTVRTDEWWGWWPAAARSQLAEPRPAQVGGMGTWESVDGFSAIEVDVENRALVSRNEGGMVGMLCSVPRRGQAGAWQAVVWPDGLGQNALVVALQVAARDSRKDWPQPGNRLDLRQDARGRIVVDVLTRDVHVRPCWTISEAEGRALEDGRARAVVWVDGQRRHAVQTAPGRLTLTSVAPEVEEEQVGRMEYLTRPFQVALPDGHRMVRHALARTQGGQLVCGYVHDAQVLQGHQYRWRMRADLLAGSTESQWLLHRRLDRPVPVRVVEKARLVSPPGQEAERRLEADIDRLVEARTPVAARLNTASGRVELMLQQLPRRDLQSAGNTLPLADAGGPQVTQLESSSGRAVLLRTEQGLVASFRDVLAIRSIEVWLAEMVGQGVVSGGEPRADQRLNLGSAALCYVGPERADPMTGEPHGDGDFVRFEWAPGYCLLVPMLRLQFNGYAFAPTADQLFFGDRIGTVALRRDETNSAWALDILEIGLFQSEGHALYLQAKRLRMVHLLRLRRSEGGVAITRVEGLQESLQAVDDVRRFRAAAVLADGAEQRVQEALGNASEGSLHGRLDRQLFRKSQGREIAFEPVWITLGEGGLRHDERLLLVGNKVRWRGNDCELELLPPDGLIFPPSQPLPRIGMGKRNFSIREDVLRRLARDKPEELVGRYLLVSLTSQDRAATAGRQPAPVVDAILVDPRTDATRRNVPTRSPRALAAWVRQLRGLALVTVVQDDPGEAMVLEVRPGVFARADDQMLECDLPRPLQHATVVRLKWQAQDRLCVLAAMPSDADLVPDEGRGITLLPMDNLRSLGGAQGALTRNDWAEWKAFSAEGLPGAVAQLGSRNEANWEAAKEAIVRRLMEPPPRPAWLSWNNHPEVRWFCIHPDWSAAVHPVRFSLTESDPLLTKWGPQGGDAVAVAWRHLSHFDAPARILATFAQTRRWRAHDVSTMQFQDNQITRVNLGEETCLTSLLFAEVPRQKDSQQLRLRYDIQVLHRFVFPPRELSSMLPDHTDTAWRVAVAGVDIERRWLIVEAIPGRVYVLPLSLLVLGDDIGYHECALHDMAADRFGIGDELVLCRAKASPTEIDRVRLVAWNPGTRSAMGGCAMALPVCAFDAERQALTLGHGGFTMTLPMVEPVFAAFDVLLIDRGNNLRRLAPGRDKVRDTGALLVISDDGSPCIDGWPGYTCRPDNDYDWNVDLFGRNLIWQGRPGRALVAAGGCVPVTLEGIVHEHRTIYFSRRLQHWQDRRGGTCLAMVLGQTDDRRCAVRLGNEIRLARLAELVEGVPENMQAPVLEALRGAGTGIWVRVADAYHEGDPVVPPLKPGVVQRRYATDTGSFLPVAIVRDQSEPDRPVVLGLLCDCVLTRTVHWLPIEKAAWVDLSSHEVHVHALFVAPGRPLRARVMRDGSLSVVDHPLALNEFRAMRPGAGVMVRSTDVRAQGRTSWVRSAVSDVILAFEGHTKPDTPEWRAVVRMRDSQAMRVACRPSVLTPKDFLDTVQAPQDQVVVLDEIRSVLAMHDVAATCADAPQAFALLVRRAWRHWATEVITWQSDPPNSGLWTRFLALREPLLASKQLLTVDQLNSQIDGFCLQVELQQWRPAVDKNLTAAGAAVRAARGDLVFTAMAAMEQAWVSHRLAELARLAPSNVGTPNQPLPQAVIDGLRVLADRLEHEQTLSNGATLRFGGPLPQWLASQGP